MVYLSLLASICMGDLYSQVLVNPTKHKANEEILSQVQNNLDFTINSEKRGRGVVLKYWIFPDKMIQNGMYLTNKKDHRNIFKSNRPKRILDNTWIKDLRYQFKLKNQKDTFATIKVELLNNKNQVMKSWSYSKLQDFEISLPIKNGKEIPEFIKISIDIYDNEHRSLTFKADSKIIATTHTPGTHKRLTHYKNEQVISPQQEECEISPEYSWVHNWQTEICKLGIVVFEDENKTTQCLDELASPLFEVMK